MKRKTIKTISIILAIILLLSTASVILFAKAEPDDENETSAVSATTEAVQTETESSRDDNQKEETTQPTEIADTENIAQEEEQKTDEISKDASAMSDDNSQIITIGSSQESNNGPYANVEFVTNQNIGTVTAVFKNNTTNDEYRSALVFNGEKYVGVVNMPLGSYSFKINADNKYKIKLKGDTVLFETSGGSITIEAQSVKNKDSGFGGFLKNNLFTLLAICAAVFIYYVYMRKQRKLNDE